MSALPLKADMCGATCHVRFGPIADMSSRRRICQRQELYIGGGLTASPPLLPPTDVAHVGQMVRDAFVTIDAGFLACKKEALMRLHRARALTRDVHRLRTVTVAAFQ